MGRMDVYIDRQCPSSRQQLVFLADSEADDLLPGSEYEFGSQELFFLFIRWTWNAL